MNAVPTIMQRKVLPALLCGASLFMFAADVSAKRKLGPPLPAPVMTSPAAGSILTSPVTFTWTTGATKPIGTQFLLEIGSSPSGNDLNFSFVLGNSATVAIDLPTNGSSVYVTVCAVEYVPHSRGRMEFVCGNSVQYLSSAMPPPAACSGQGLIGIDPVHKVGYVPIYTLDGSGNGQVAVVDLTVGAVTPVIKTLSLAGASRAIATAYNPNNSKMYVESETFAGGVEVVEIDTNTKLVTNVVPTSGLDGSFFGGMLEDPTRNIAFVAGGTQVGVLDTSVSPPVWNAASVVATVGTDSLSYNLNTKILFISADGNNEIIDTTTTSSLVPMSFNSGFSVTDGNAFDVGTSIFTLTQEVGADRIWAFNFASLTTSPSPATAPYVEVAPICPGGGTGCLSETSPIGEGPGGQLVINCETHQAIVMDEFGQNLKLIHLPTAPVVGALDNNGRPGSGIPADAASVYTIAETVIPQGLVGTTLTQLGAVGDPNSLSVDPANNFAYMLADTAPYYHGWSPGSTIPLFLVRVDLSAPVSGASPTGGINGSTYWTPASPPTAAIPMP